jgi:hypothetical protein
VDKTSPGIPDTDEPDNGPGSIAIQLYSDEVDPWVGIKKTTN